MRVRALRAEDDRQRFESGHPEIDDFFQRYAGQNQWRQHIGVTYCLFRGEYVAGFVTLSAGDIDPRELPDGVGARLPRYSAPVLRLARMGVTRELHGTGLGQELLYVTAVIALEMRARTGCVGILVDAKPEAVGYYERHGFQLLPVVSRMAGAGARPVRLFCDVPYLINSIALAEHGASPAESLALEIRRRARELGLTPQQVREAVDQLLGEKPE